MSEPRFQILSMARRSSAASFRASVDPAADRRSRGAVFVWRLLGANNRELARGVDHYRSAQECERVVNELKLRGPNHLAARISFDPGTHGWFWVLKSERGDIARSARSFSRQRECMYSLDQFRDKFPEAAVHLPKPKRQAAVERVVAVVPDTALEFE